VQAPDKDSAQELVEQACSKLLANPVMEDFQINLIEGVQNGVPA
jgi:phosphoribosylformylglycinamidine (FGAM) synthase PurS component